MTACWRGGLCKREGSWHVTEGADMERRVGYAEGAADGGNPQPDRWSCTGGRLHHGDACRANGATWTHDLLAGRCRLWDQWTSAEGCALVERALDRRRRLGGRFAAAGAVVSGVTRTSLGEIMVIGVCIPWFGSRTEARRNLERRKRWEDHEQYLAGLAEILGRGPVKRCMVMGDFNQTIGPGSRAPLSCSWPFRMPFRRTSASLRRSLSTKGVQLSTTSR